MPHLGRLNPVFIGEIPGFDGRFPRLSGLGDGPGQGVALCTPLGPLRAWLLPGAERTREVGKT